MRSYKGMTQKALARLVGRKHQQIASFESGSARVSAAALLDIAGALGGSPEFFLQDLLAQAPAHAPETSAAAAMRQARQLASDFLSIDDQELRTAILRIMRDCARLGRQSRA